MFYGSVTKLLKQQHTFHNHELLHGNVSLVHPKTRKEEHVHVELKVKVTYPGLESDTFL